MCDRVSPLFVGDVRTSANQFDTASTAEDVRVFEFESSRAARLSRSNVGIARVESCAGKVSQLAEIDGYVFGDREREHNPAVADTRMRRGEVTIQAVEKRRRAADDDRIAVTGIEREAVYRHVQIEREEDVGNGCGEGVAAAIVWHNCGRPIRRVAPITVCRAGVGGVNCRRLRGAE